MKARSAKRSTKPKPIHAYRKVGVTSKSRTRKIKSDQKITPFLWFDGQAEEAANFYISIFENARILEVARYGEAGPGEKDSVMTVSFDWKDRSSTRSLHQLVLHGIVHELSVVSEAHFFQDAAAIGADGFYT